MARTYYHDFLDYAREEFGLSYAQAQSFYRELGKEGFEAPDYLDFMVAEEIEEYVPEFVEPEFEFFGDLEGEYDWEEVGDYWLEEGVEIEIAPELVYEEGKT